MEVHFRNSGLKGLNCIRYIRICFGFRCLVSAAQSSVEDDEEIHAANVERFWSRKDINRGKDFARDYCCIKSPQWNKRSAICNSSTAAEYCRKYYLRDNFWSKVKSTAFYMFVCLTLSTSYCVFLILSSQSFKLWHFLNNRKDERCSICHKVKTTTKTNVFMYYKNLTEMIKTAAIKL